MTEDHRPNTEQISALAGGELDAAEAAPVRSAIDTDEELRAEYKSLLATASLLATTPAARAPRNYSTSLPPESIAPWWMRWSPTLLATAAVALIAFALIDLQGPRLGRADRSSVVAEIEIALAVASPSDSTDTAGSAQVAAAPPAARAQQRSAAPSSVRPGTPAEAAEAPPSEIEVAVEAEAEAAVAAPAPSSRKAEAAESGLGPEVSAAAAAPDEALAVEVVTVAESAPAQAVGADATLADDFGEDAAAPDAPIDAALAEPTDPTAPSPESIAVPSPVMPDPGLVFDPVWLAALAAGSVLLIAAGFAYVFRPR